MNKTDNMKIKVEEKLEKELKIAFELKQKMGKLSKVEILVLTEDTIQPCAFDGNDIGETSVNFPTWMLY